MPALGIGIVGTGQRCMYFFGPYIKAHPEKARLVALADYDESRLNSAVVDLGGDIRSYHSLDDMVKDPQVEAVIITTPDFTHREMLEKGLEAGKHTICEKPMATTIEDALDMTRRAMASKQVVQIGFMLRYAPFVVKLREIIESGAICPLLQINASEVVEYYHGAAFFRRWHRFRRKSGGLLVHKACHTLDVINWIIGSRPAWVTASGGTQTFVPKQGAAERCRDCALTAACPAAYRVDAYNWIYQTRKERHDPLTYANDLCVYNSEKDSVDNAVMNVQYENGVRLTFSFSTTGARHERHFLLIGQNGQIHASQANGTIGLETVGGISKTIEFPEEMRDEHGGGDEPLIDSFLQCVATERRPVADILAGLYSVALGVAATQSIGLNGQRVDLTSYLDQAIVYGS